MTPPTLGEIALEPLIEGMDPARTRACYAIIGELREMRRRRDAWRNRVETFLDEWSHLTTQARLARHAQKKAENEKEGLHRTIASVNEENVRLGDEVRKLVGEILGLRAQVAELEGDLSEEREKRKLAEERFDRITDPDISKDSCVMCGDYDCDCFCHDCGQTQDDCCCIDWGLEDHIDLEDEDMEL